MTRLYRDFKSEGVIHKWRGEQLVSNKITYLFVVGDGVSARQDDAVARDGGADVVAARQLARVPQRQRLVVRVQRRVD